MKFGLEVKVPQIPVVGVPVHGESVKSIDGEADWKFVYSELESVKIISNRLFIEGPAGYQKSPEHPPEGKCVTQIWLFA